MHYCSFLRFEMKWNFEVLQLIYSHGGEIEVVFLGFRADMRRGRVRINNRLS